MSTVDPIWKLADLNVGLGKGVFKRSRRRYLRYHPWGGGRNLAWMLEIGLLAKL